MIGPLLRLRSEITREDAQLIAKWLEDAEATRYLSDAPDVSRAICQALSRVNLPYVTHLFNQGGRFFLAERGGTPVGFVRLAQGNQEMQIVLLVERNRWRNGLGISILREALKYAFFELRTPRVTAVIHRENHRSLRLFARAGFLPERGEAWMHYTLTLANYLQNIQGGRIMADPIYITRIDRERLNRLLDDATFGLTAPDKSFRALREEIDRALVVEAEKLPACVVSMRSRALISLDGEEEEVSLVYPDEANWSTGRLSILSPIGTALLGYREGDRIDWETPGGRKRIEIRKLLYQPEAAGDYHL